MAQNGCAATLYSRKATTELSSGRGWGAESRRGWEGGLQQSAKTLPSAENNGRPMRRLAH
jgi:hypothetical protein